MQMPTSEGSEQLLRSYGKYHLAALKAEGAALAEMTREFEGVQSGLQRVYDLRVGLESAQAECEALRVVSETAVEQTLGKLDLQVLGAVNRRRGDDPYKSAFPDGVTGAISPRGRAQSAEATRIANYIAPLAGPSPEGIPAESLPVVATLRGQIATFDGALASETATDAAYAAAFLAEFAARRAWREQYRKNFGLLTARFGTNKKKIESFFKKVAKSGKGGGGGPGPAAGG